MAAILVTGGAGYIGSHTAHLLRRHGYDVVIVDDLSRGHEHNVRGFPFHKLRMQDTAALTDLLQASRIEAVIHFAAFIAVGESTKVPELYFSNNTGGTMSLLTAMVDAGVSKIVFSSTAAVYGMPQTVPIPETSPYAPLSPYGDSKVMVEKILAWMDQFRNLRSVCLRYFNACGADAEAGLGEEHDPETHLIPLLLRAVTTGEPSHALRRRLSDRRRHLHSRLHPRDGSRRRAPARFAASAERRRIPALQCGDWVRLLGA
jgi:UDP-glucose 4-epimerase